MEQLKLIPFIFLMIGISAIIGGAMAIVLSEFGESTTKCFNTSYTFNQTRGECLNNTGRIVASGSNGLNFSEEYFVIVQGTEGVATTASQLSTIAIIGVMIIIIGLISSVFVYFRYFY